MKDLKHQKETTSYMQLCLTMENKNNVYLMVPTYWDEPHKEWMGYFKTPAGKILYASGKNSKELQDNFNVVLHNELKERPEETFALFKPLEYWESRL
jgi:hypothetical protein